MFTSESKTTVDEKDWAQVYPCKDKFDHSEGLFILDLTIKFGSANCIMQDIHCSNHRGVPKDLSLTGIFHRLAMQDKQKRFKIECRIFTFLPFDRNSTASHLQSCCNSARWVVFSGESIFALVTVLHFSNHQPSFLSCLSSNVESKQKFSFCVSHYGLLTFSVRISLKYHLHPPTQVKFCIGRPVLHFSHQM